MLEGIFEEPNVALLFVHQQDDVVAALAPVRFLEGPFKHHVILAHQRLDLGTLAGHAHAARHTRHQCETRLII